MLPQTRASMFLPTLLTWIVLGAGPTAAQDARPAYAIDATVDGHWIDGVAELHLPPDLLHRDGVHLAFGSPSAEGEPVGMVLEVTDEDGRPLQGRPGPNGSTTYTLSSSPAGDDARLQVRFHAALDPDDLAGLGYYLFPSNQPGARWYPDILSPNGVVPRFADFDVRLEWPDSLTVLTSGGREEERVERGRRQARFRATHVEGFTLALGPGHERIELEQEGVRVEVMAPPALMEEYRSVGQRTLEAAAFYRELYGFFPNERLGILPGPEGFWGGWPMPNLFMIHRGNLTEDFVRFITAHELGHYYWGLHVLDEEERLGWLMLANGILADQIYLADLRGRTLEEQWRARGEGDWLQNFLTVQVAGWEQRLGMTRAEARPLHFDYNSLVRHGKGATGLYLQVRRLGIHRFVALQRELLREFRYRPLDLKTFVARLEAAGAVGASDFFDRWMRDDATIGYEVVAVEPVEDEAGASHVVVERTGTIPYPVEVEAVGADGRMERWTLSTTAERDTLRTSLERPLLRVRLDPDGAVPMWNSAHPGIQRLYIHALYGAGLTEPFLTLAAAYLEHHEDPAMARRREAALARSGGDRSRR